jgi:hypothetical protein
MKPLANQRRQKPAASPAQPLHHASPLHAETEKKICNLHLIIFEWRLLAHAWGLEHTLAYAYGAGPDCKRQENIQGT